jgi:hypothetical protein
MLWYQQRTNLMLWYQQRTNLMLRYQQRTNLIIRYQQRTSLWCNETSSRGPNLPSLDNNDAVMQV